MPRTTIDGFQHHGRVRLSIEDHRPEAKAQLAALEDIGIDYDYVTQQLQAEGLQKFKDSFDTLWQRIDRKRKVLQQKRAA